MAHEIPLFGPPRNRAQHLVPAPYGARFRRRRIRDPLSRPVALAAAFGGALLYFAVVLLWIARTLY